MDDELKKLAEDEISQKFGDGAGEAASDALGGNTEAAVSKLGSIFGIGGQHGAEADDNDDKSDDDSDTDNDNSDSDDSN